MSPRRPVDPLGTLDLLDLLAEAEQVAAAPPPPRPPEPERQRPAVATCACTDRRAAGFTSPRPGWWVHAGCGLPTPEYAAAVVALAGGASPVQAPEEHRVPEQAPTPAVEVAPPAQQALPAPLPSRQRPEWPPRAPARERRALVGNPAAYQHCRITRAGTGVVVDVALTRERIAQLREQGWRVTAWLDGRAPIVPESDRPSPERITR